MPDRLDHILSLVQTDPGQRGLCADPNDNLLTATAGDYAAACRKLAALPEPSVAVITGFTIPTARPPCGETDGPLGALYLARALVPLGIRVALASDGTTVAALRAGVAAAGLEGVVTVAELPDVPGAYGRSLTDNFENDRINYFAEFLHRVGSVNALIACERVGPNHTLESLLHAGAAPTRAEFMRDVPAGAMGRCYSMRGRDLTDLTRPAHLLFETPRHVITGGLLTLGIGDGGNEIGMGRVPWATIRRNVPNGGLVACRVRTDELIVAGISNWGAYALAAGVYHQRQQTPAAALFDTNVERELLEIMIAAGPLVDGVTLASTTTVDGLEFPRYAQVLTEINRLWP